MNDENVEWVIQELNLTAERAKTEGISPTEFLAGLVHYVDTFREDYTDVGGDTANLRDTDDSTDVEEIEF